MRAAVRKNSSLSELSALRCSFTFYREISPDSPDLSLGNDYHSKYFLISTDICRWRETENDVAGLQWVVYFLLGEGLDFRKLKLSIKKAVETCWQGPGCDGETLSLFFPILSHTPPIIAGFTVTSRAMLRGWAMGAVSFLPFPDPVDWFPPPQTWHGFSWKKLSRFRVWGLYSLKSACCARICRNN